MMYVPLRFTSSVTPADLDNQHGSQPLESGPDYTIEKGRCVVIIVVKTVVK